MNVVNVYKWLTVCRMYVKTVTKEPHKDKVGFQTPGGRSLSLLLTSTHCRHW